MRLHLAGYDNAPLSPLVLTLEDGVPFLPADYILQGYTNFDLIVIGGAGGQGATVLGSTYFVFGGGGGGGGIHRVAGELKFLPDSCKVIVGSGGADAPNVAWAGGTDGVWNSASASHGGDGGYSSFAYDPDNPGSWIWATAFASGGQGGRKPTQTAPYSMTTGAGGAGGKGRSFTPGGGGAGGTGRKQDGTSPTSTAGSDGTWDGTIGGGGGGGAGGYLQDTPGGPIPLAATAGGRGAYNASNTSVSGAKGTAGYFSGAYNPGGGGSSQIVPGFGGGARAEVLSGLSRAYGTKGPGTGAGVGDFTGDGLVMIKLTRVS